MLAISEQQLRGWQRHGFIPGTDTFSFSDLIALRALQKLRQNKIPSKQIGRALVSLNAWTLPAWSKCRWDRTT